MGFQAGCSVPMAPAQKEGWEGAQEGSGMIMDWLHYPPLIVLFCKGFNIDKEGSPVCGKERQDLSGGIGAQANIVGSAQVLAATIEYKLTETENNFSNNFYYFVKIILSVHACV